MRIAGTTHGVGYGKGTKVTQAGLGDSCGASASGTGGATRKSVSKTVNSVVPKGWAWMTKGWKSPIFRFEDHRPVHHTTVHRNRRTVGILDRLQYLRCPHDLVRGGPKAPVDDGDLARVNAQLPAEPESASSNRSASKTFLVGKIGPYPVYRRPDSGKARDERQVRLKIQQLIFVSVNSKVDLKIQRAKHEPLHAARLRDLGRPVKTSR